MHWPVLSTMIKALFGWMGGWVGGLGGRREGGSNELLYARV